MEFRPRDYSAEAKLFLLHRDRAEIHPLSVQSSQQAHIADDRILRYDDPLRADDNATVSGSYLEDIENSPTIGVPSESAFLPAEKEWSSFTRFMTQRFPVSKLVSVTSVSNAIIKVGKTYERTSTGMHLEELEDPQNITENEVKVINRQDYINRLREFKDDLVRAWNASDRVTSLKISVKVAKLLKDTSVLQFYPTLFILVTDILDMLGNFVWDRIKRKAEFTDDGAKICSLPENFKIKDICQNAKETCHNWFCKIGAIQELLPRIYLELALLPCWQFLCDQPVVVAQRLVVMARGLADPLASAYCRLYLTHCAQKLPSCEVGVLVSCVNDMNAQLKYFIPAKETGSSTDNKVLLVGVMEPTIEYIVKCIFKYASQRQLDGTLLALGLGRNMENSQCVSIVLHHILKELAVEVVSSNAMEFLQLIDHSNDSSFRQFMNYRLLGLRLCEKRPPVYIVDAVMNNVLKVIAQNESLDEYLTVIDAYLDIVLQSHLDSCIKTILEAISQRTCNKGIDENGVLSLQSIVGKLLSHYQHLEDVFALSHFLEILDVLVGRPRTIVIIDILKMATRNSCIRDPATIELLFEISQALNDSFDFANMKDDDNQPEHLLSRFVQLVDFGIERERHLAFLVECRGAFGKIDELKETLVHSSNGLAVKALKDVMKHANFVKACIAFSEVTLPSISAQIKQFNLYLETAEVAWLAGLVSHSDELIDSAISCLHNMEIKEGSRAAAEAELLLSSIKKLCSFLVMLPGNPGHGSAYFPKILVSFVNDIPWMTPRMRTGILCAVLPLLAACSQNRLPYHADNGVLWGSNNIFFGDSAYLYELVSLSKHIVRNLVDAVLQESSPAARGVMALEACNSILSSFTIKDETYAICSKLIETAKLCMNESNKYLQSTFQLLEEKSKLLVKC
ncbi:VPS35 endosomal protein-sorting factor-like isoform X3 [Benincasa hispida]|uniref:VPS35 endosomal protein-sorting factor-like isoform X3 n=1 Tax=Benincasa hispida TaxID=102211 RepID=UPI0019024D50|nr:VPS35 endosomal protein-sorting factor-like isoform X3 [Benincasa hispida]